MGELKVPQTALTHHGVKGMRWGVRNAHDFSSTDHTERNRKIKKAAKIAGITLGAAALVVGSIYAAKYMKTHGALPISHVESDIGKKFVEKTIQEPMGIIHGSRGKNAGFRFMQKGGVSDPLHLYDQAGFNNDGQFSFKRFGKANHVAARFLNPDGKTDFAGRQIPHEVIIPGHMAKDLHNIDDVKNHIWPMLKDHFDSEYMVSSEDLRRRKK